jgi:hypothetical protein
MPDSPNMKKLWIITIPLVLGLWAGYALGYHQGTREEASAWLATGPTEGRDSTDGHLFCYRNPHMGPFYTSLHPRAVNVPDPRVYRQYSSAPQR